LGHTAWALNKIVSFATLLAPEADIQNTGIHSLDSGAERRTI
jgi:hypothetical protein